MIDADTFGKRLVLVIFFSHICVSKVVEYVTVVLKLSIFQEMHNVLKCILPVHDVGVCAGDFDPVGHAAQLGAFNQDHAITGPTEQACIGFCPSDDTKRYRRNR